MKVALIETSHGIPPSLTHGWSDFHRPITEQWGSIFTFSAQSKVTLSRCSNHSVWSAVKAAKDVQLNVVMEKKPCIDGFPITASIYRGWFRGYLSYLGFIYPKTCGTVDLNLRDCLDLFSIIAIEDIRLVDARPRFQQQGAVIVALNNPVTGRLPSGYVKIAIENGH